MLAEGGKGKKKEEEEEEEAEEERRRKERVRGLWLAPVASALLDPRDEVRLSTFPPTHLFHPQRTKERRESNSPLPPTHLPTHSTRESEPEPPTTSWSPSSPWTQATISSPS